LRLRPPLAAWFCKGGHLAADETSAGHARNSSGNGELIFLGHPPESLGRVLDPIRAIIAIGEKQPDDLIGAAGTRTNHKCQA
jgi:hypothetical protein